MYLAFFGLGEKPFAITPDPRYLYLSERHAEALAHLVYGVSEAGGFVQLTGEVGTGKTTIVRSLLGQIPANAEVALILNPRMTAPEFLLTICEELGIGVPDSAEGSVKDLVDILNHYLLRAHADGRRVVLVVDEAQNLAPDVLEQVRLLTNLETHTQKLLQIILIGQPELRELLDRADLRQLAQRVTGRYHLDPLSPNESAAYVRHRLRVAGATTDIFSNTALAEIQRLSKGIPRVINVIADRALLGAYTQDRHRVTSSLVRRGASEVLGRRLAPVWMPWLLGAATAVVLAMAGFAVWRYVPWSANRTDVVASETESKRESPTSSASAKPTEASGAAGKAVGVITREPTESAQALMQRYAAETTLDDAYTKLFRLWGATYTKGGIDACVQASQQGLECLAQKGSFAQLRLYNRPAVLMLVDETGTARQLVLTALGDEEAWVDLGEAKRAVGIAGLAKIWYGDFLLLWKPASPQAKDLVAGMRGDDVRWLRRSLETLAGRTPQADVSDFYDADLAVMVQEFQRARRLNVDGIAGLQTQIALDAALPAPGTPVLVPADARGS